MTTNSVTRWIQQTLFPKVENITNSLKKKKLVFIERVLQVQTLKGKLAEWNQLV